MVYKWNKDVCYFSECKAAVNLSFSNHRIYNKNNLLPITSRHVRLLHHKQCKWGYFAGHNTYLYIPHYNVINQRQFYLKMVFRPKSGRQQRQAMISECDSGWWCLWKGWFCWWHPPSEFTVYLNKREKMIEIWDGSCSCRPALKLPYQVQVAFLHI